jgi:hypothetical protein
VSFNSYAALKASVQLWLARNDILVTGTIPDFIRLGEERIAGKLRVSQMVVRTTLVVPAASNYVALPTDWLGFKQVGSLDYPQIEYMPTGDLLNLPGSGRADRYSIEGGKLYFGQTVTAPLTLNIAYYQAVPLLSVLGAAGSTWLLLKAPSVYLYATLIEAALFVKKADKAEEWGMLMDKACDALETQDAAAMISGSTLRSSGPFWR